MLPVLFVIALVAAALLARSKLSYKWTVDRANNSYSTDLIKATLEPLFAYGRPIGFDLTVENLTDRQANVEWENSFYVNGGATNGKLFDYNAPFAEQQRGPLAADIILPKSTMKRELVPASRLHSYVPSQTVVNPIIVEPIIVEPPEVNPKPPKKPDEEEMTKVIITDGAEIKPPKKKRSSSVSIPVEGQDDQAGAPLIQLRDVLEKDDRNDGPSEMKVSSNSTRRTIINSAQRWTHETSFRHEPFGDGTHGVMINMMVDGHGPTQVVMSFDLKYEKVKK